MFEEEKLDGADFVVKENHHIYEKWNDFRRIRNKWLYGLWGHMHNRIAWTENGIPYWNYPPRVNRYTKEIVYDDQELIVQQINNPRWAKRYRSRNGSVEWGYVQDAWAKPHVEGKSSRKTMHLKKIWWKEAEETLHPPALDSVE